MAALTLIETGGTICMQAGPLGLHPAADVLREAILALQPGLHLQAHVLQPLVDSADVGPVVWNTALELIRAATGPVIITHGTDTMAYTGAALDAALVGQGASVMLCGSMQPLGTPGGDAEANLALALQAAGEVRPGVWLAFDGRLMAAGALTKVHSQQAAAFEVVGDPAPPPHPKARTYDPDLLLSVITITPGLHPRALEAALAPLDGAVLRVFGAGTLPAGLAKSVARACAKGCKITAISQCAGGGLEPGAYAAGAALWTAGVENGGAMSAEQALTRLWLRLSAGA